MKATEHWNSQAACDSNGRPPERTFSGNVDHVRAIAHPHLLQQRSGRQAELQTLVSRQRQAGDQRDARVEATAVRPVLSGTYDRDSVPDLLQSLHEMAQSKGNAVDL